eukprot:COSAG05_NODE_5679_length_1117_cov_1.254420_1_plen_136_part_00
MGGSRGSSWGPSVTAIKMLARAVDILAGRILAGRILLAWQRLHLATGVFNQRVGGESTMFVGVMRETTLLRAIAKHIMISNSRSIRHTFQRFEDIREATPLQIDSVGGCGDGEEAAALATAVVAESSGQRNICGS